MRKLCFVTFQFKTGGVERIFTSIANNLDHEIALMTITNRYDSMIDNIPSSVKVIPIHETKWFKFLWSINDYIPFLPFVLILLSEIIYLRCSKKWQEYTFVNFSDTISSLLVSYYGSTFKKRYSWLHYNPKTMLSSKFVCLYKFIYRKMHKIICICNEQKELLLNVVPGLQEEKVHVIYNIMDHDLILEKKNGKIDYVGKYILMIARFDFRSKDFFTLIDAYHKLDSFLKEDYKLLFMGDGPDLKKVIQYVASKKEQDNIVFIGKEDNPYKWINKAEMLVLSSKTEGLPTVLIEALICGTATISTICETGPKEILENGKSGLLVPVGNVELLAKAMKDLLSDENLKRSLIANGLERAKQFHPYQILPQIEKIWIN